MAFPGWSEFEGPDSADTEDADGSEAARLRSRRGVTLAGDQASLTSAATAIPVVLSMPSSPGAGQEWIDHGEVPELAKSKNISFLDIDSGHWPMISA